MNFSDIENFKRKIAKDDNQALDSIRNLDSETLKNSISNLNLGEVAKKMRELNLNDAADKLDTMTDKDIINQLSENPKVLETLKKLFD